MAEEMLKTYRYLGNSGMKVSPLCLGTLTFGEYVGLPGQCDEKLAISILDRFAELGGNFIDTSNSYGKGESERMIGKWLVKQNRQKFVIATKVFIQHDPKNPNTGGLSRKTIMWSVNESLRRLQTDYIDLLQIHFTDPATPIEETLRALDDLVKSGKVLYIGCSNAWVHELQKYVDYGKFLGLNRWVSLQMQYSLLEREIEREHRDICKKEGLGFLPWSALGGGWLTGKIKRDTKPGTETRVGAMEETDRKNKIGYSAYANKDWVWNLLDKMKEIADEKGKTVAQVALRWVMQKDFVSSVIFGCKNIAQLESNMAAATGWELSDEQMACLDELSAQKNSTFEEVMAFGHTGRDHRY